MQWRERSPVPLALELAQQHEQRFGVHHWPSWISVSLTVGLVSLGSGPPGGALLKSPAELLAAALLGSSTGLLGTVLVAALTGVSGSSLSASEAGALVLTMPVEGSTGAVCSSLKHGAALSSETCMYSTMTLMATVYHSMFVSGPSQQRAQREHEGANRYIDSVIICASVTRMSSIAHNQIQVMVLTKTHMCCL